MNRVATTDGAVHDVSDDQLAASPVLAQAFDLADADDPPLPVPLTSETWEAVWRDPNGDDDGVQDHPFRDALNAADFLAAQTRIDALLDAIVARAAQKYTWDFSDPPSPAAQLRRLRPLLPSGKELETIERECGTPGGRGGARDAYFTELGRGVVPLVSVTQMGSGPALGTVSHPPQGVVWARAVHSPADRVYTFDVDRGIDRGDRPDAFAELELRIRNPESLPIESLFEFAALEVDDLRPWDRVYAWMLPGLCRVHGRPQPVTEDGVATVHLPLMGTHGRDAMCLPAHQDVRLAVRGLTPSAEVLGIHATFLRRRDRQPFQLAFSEVTHGVSFTGDDRVPAGASAAVIRLLFNHRVHALLIDGLDLDDLLSIYMILDGVALRLLHPGFKQRVEWLEDRLSGVANREIAEEAGRRLRAACVETAGRTLVFRLSDGSPHDAAFDATVPDFSHVDDARLVIHFAAGAPADEVDVRIAAVHANLVRFDDGLANQPYPW